MLICPQCQFANPNTNKFCQGCGTSLTHKVCAECGTSVALNEKQCPNCGAKTGTVWWAIVSGTTEGARDWGQGTRNEVGTRGAGIGARDEVGDSSQSSSPQSLTSSPSYLDSQQRYQLLEPLVFTAETDVTFAAQVRVLDTQPFQLSLLEAGADLMMEQAIPADAKTYTALQPKLGQQLPAIHDAWQQGSQQVLLIADRSHWREMMALWHENTTTPLQILHWFDDMVQLWAALEPWGCCQSLLELSNLRVDATGKLGLQRLYFQPTEKPCTLPDLGQVWQWLFHESQRTKFGSLVELMTDLQAGSIQTIDELRSRLKAIVDEMQVDIPSSADFPPVSNAASAAAVNRAEVGVTLNNSAAPTIIQMNESQESLMKSEELPTLMLPMHLVDVESAGGTDVGRQRHHNEDCFGIATSIDKIEFPNNQKVEARGVYVLCDGMGGHAGGEVASDLAVKTLLQYFQTHWQPHQPIPNEQSIREAIRLTNQAIYDLNQHDARSGVGRMGTTLVLVLLYNTQIAIAHVGDSRLYSLSRKQGLLQMTLDHEVGQREILRGVEPEIAYARPDAYQLTQALGPRDENYVNPDVQFFDLNEDTLLLLVSDGVSDNALLEEHWQTHLEPLITSGNTLQRGVSELIDLANQYNGHDNITAVMIRLKVRPKLEP
ncbi:MAG TPA: serine/threonine protein phosphatase [Cyanobacteria bacterium UBA11049]|nr:serine/threonine protein phosphatase [Cyanobacteria bacterium UBA11049]